MLCLDYGYKLASSPADLTRLQINFLMAAMANRMERWGAARASREGATKFVFVEDE